MSEGVTPGEDVYILLRLDGRVRISGRVSASCRNASATCAVCLSLLLVVHWFSLKSISILFGGIWGC